MKKIISLFILILSFSSNIFAYTFEEISSIIKNSTGWFYNPKTFRLEYIYMNDSSYIYNLAAYDIIEKKVNRSGSGGRSYISNKSYNLDGFMKQFEVKNNKIISLEEYDGIYYPTNTKSEKELLDFLEKAVFKKFDACLGTYVEKKSGRKYIISRSGEFYKLQIIYQNEDFPVLEDLLSVSSAERLVGSKSNIIIYDDYFTIYDPKKNKNLVTNKDGDEFYPAFSFGNENKNNYGESLDFKKEILTSLKDTRYVFDYDKTKLIKYIPDEDAVKIQTYDEDKKEWHEESFNYFRLFIDENGWKHLKVGEFDCIFIDGNHKTGVFAYKGDGVSKDSVALDNQFKSFENDAPSKFGTVNGMNFENPKASSTLKEKTTEYKVQGLFNTYLSNGYLSGIIWNKKSIPWVEGKSGDGIGEFIETDIIDNNDSNIVGLRLYVLGGYVDPLKPYLFKQNNRIKKLLVETDTGFSKVIEFLDVVEFTEIVLPAGTKHVKLTIKDVYKGSKYSDTCITALDVDYIWDY